MSTLMQSIADLINKEIHKFAKRVNEEFPQISINEMLSIWCEQQQICGFEIPSLDEDSSVNAEKNKICQHMHTTGRKVNTQCTTKIKGIGDYCSKHSKT
jgi:hypothetical protein